MNKSHKLLIVGIIIILFAGFVLGVFGFMKGTQNTLDELDEEDQIQNDFSLSDLSDEAVSAFQKELIDRALARGPHPIEGFDAFMLLYIFPGLEEKDFDGVATGSVTEEGRHSYVNGELQWKRTLGNQPATSAERTVLKKGYETLLDNLSQRLNMPASSVEEVIAIIDEIDI